jgi:hypothetical protein
MARETQLSWFPFHVKRWKQLVRGLTRDEVAALLFATMEAWDDGSSAPVLRDRIPMWEHLLGSGVHELEPFLRGYFKPDARYPGCVVWTELLELWETQHEKVQRRIEAGRKGAAVPTAEGKKRGRPRTRERPLELPIPEPPPEPPPRGGKSNAISNANSNAISGHGGRGRNSNAVSDLRRVSPVPNGTRVKTRRVDAPLLAADGRVASPRGSPPDQVAAHRPELVVPRERRRRLDDEPDTLPGELPRDLELPADWRALLEQAGAMPARARAPAAPAAGGDASTRPEYSAEDLAYFAALDERLREKRAKRASEIATDAA